MPRKKRIAKAQKGLERVTLKDVAEIAGVSHTTVSYVLNDPEGKIPIREETRKRVWEAVRKLNYVPNLAAKSLITGKTARIGVLLAKSRNLFMSGPFYSRILDGLEIELNRKNYQITLASVPDQELHSDMNRVAATMNSSNVDGLVIVGWVSEDVDRILPHDMVRVYVVAMPKHIKTYAYVGEDNEAGINELMGYLLSLGHRHIAYLGELNAVESSSRERFETYKKALQTAGLEFHEEYARDCGNPWSDQGYYATTPLFNLKPRPTAIVCMNDKIAVLAMKAVHDYGLEVPKDISITGFGDIDLVAHMNPPLTTVKVFLEELGKLAAEELTERIENKIRREQRIDLVKPILIIRHSCAPPRVER